MAKKTSAWLKGCAVGCGVVALLVVILGGLGAFYVGGLSSSFDRAIASRESAEERFGGPGEYVPNADGSVAEDRLQVFLAVRRDLQPFCERFEATFGVFEKMEERTAEERPGARDVLTVMKTAFSIGPLLGEYLEARNKALLERGMGFGEYSYLFVMAHAAGPDRGGRDDSRLHGRREDVVRMLTAQRDAARAVSSSAELVPPLDTEVAALEEDPHRTPWAGGLPQGLEASLAPHRDELDALYCRPEAEHALTRSERRGISIHAN